MLKTLIADDEISELNAIEKYLRDNYQDKIEICAKCKNGSEAIEKALETKPDLALLDIQMPVHSGLEVARAIKEKDPKALIVIITAHSLFSYAKESISIGVHDYILKPVDQNELKRVIDGILDVNKETLKKELNSIVTHLANATLNKEESHPVVRLAMNYLHENYSKHVSMELMAEEIGFSSSYVSKCLVKYTGKNFNDLLLEIRCDEAVKLLAKGNLRVNEVAYAVGFSDPNYFNRCFKGLMGKSPKKYANAMVGNLKNKK